MNARSEVIEYRPGLCAICDGPVATTEVHNNVHLHVLGPTAALTIECSIHSRCLPNPADLHETTRALSARLINWYCGTPSRWPAFFGSDQ